MGLLDQLKRTAVNAAQNAAQSAARQAVSKLSDAAGKTAGKAVNKLSTTTETFRFETLPTTVAQLQALPEAALNTPYQAAALTICALCAYADDREAGTAMLNALKGPQPLTMQEKSFLNDRFMDGKRYIPFSYFQGATPENDYTPAQPYTVQVFSNPHSFEQEGYALLWVSSGGADSPREVKLRRKGEQWFLWEQRLLSGIRMPKSQDPWA